jgi:hypothetical protein
MCISLSANEVGPQMQTLCPYYQQGGPPRRAGQYRLEPQLAYTPPEITQGAQPLRDPHAEWRSFSPKAHLSVPFV